MTTRGTVRNRGISIAAAAVTAALVAPAISPVAPNVLPAAHAQEDAPAPAGDGAAPANPAPTEEPAEINGQQAIWADAIANGYVKSVTDLQTNDNVLSGRAFEVSQRGNAAGSRLPQVPAGTTVYMQWIDTDGLVSPYYAAKVSDGETLRGAKAQGGPGSYAFDLREPWIDANGVERKYEARKGQKYRLWIPAYERDGVKYHMIRQADPLMPGAFVDTTDVGNGSTYYLNHNKQFTRILMGQVPQVDLMTRPRDEWQDGTIKGEDGQPVVLTGLLPGKEYKNTVSGTVWKETGLGADRANMATGPNYTLGSDFLFSDATVVFSKLTPEGFAEYDKVVNSLPEEQRTEAAMQFLKEHPEAIAYTYYTKTNKDGQYTIQLPEGAIPDGLASSIDDIWMGVLDEKGNPIGGYSPWMVPQFHNPRVFETLRPGDPNNVQIPVVNGPTTVGNKLTSIAFATLPGYDAYLEITNYDTSDRPAAPGDEAKLELYGTLPPLDSWIEWRDPNGNIVKGGPDQCKIVNGSLGECATFRVPDDAEPGTIYTAYLVNGTATDKNDIAADSFIVAGKQNSEFEPEYEKTPAPQGQETTVPAPKDKDGKDLPEGTKFTKPDSPETKVIGPDGTPIDEFPGELKINEDGSIVVTPKDDAPLGEYKVPVLVTYPDGSKETIYAPIEVTKNPTASSDYKVAYDEAKGQPDTDIKATPKSVGKDALPEGTTYAQGEKKETHDGLWDISDPDAKSGEVTGKASWDKLKQRYEDERKNTLGSDECKPGESFTDEQVQAIIDKLKPLFSAESTVNATYTDTIKQDNIPVKFTLVDKNGKPLAESNDWDGDGVDNETEIKDCKNPLDPNDQNDPPKTIADETTPDWKDTSTKPGEPVDVPNMGDKLPEGSKVTVPSEVDGWKVELQPDGETIKVTPPADVKKDDKVTVPVEVTYPDGSKDTDEFTVTVTDADKKPNWDDTSTTPDTPVDIPNTGGPVKDGTTVEVEGPGKAELKPDGTITVTPNDDAKPGDEVVVKVKDKDGNEVDDVTVTINDPNNPDWNDTSTTPGTPTDIPNTGGPVKDGTTIEVEGPGKAELKPDGTITVTPNDDAKPGEKVVVTVKDPNGKVIDTITVTVDPHPDWNDTKTPANKPVDIPKTPESGKVQPGTTVTVTDGPADAKLNPDGSITVTPKPEAKKGDKVTVEVKDKNGKVIDTINVELTAPVRDGSSLTDDERNRCIAVSVGFGLPLIALVPLGLAMSMSIPGLTPVVEQVSNQIQRANSELQRQLGVFNPEAARMSAQLDATLRQFGLSTAQVGSALAALIIGITAAASIASACTPGNGSSIDEIEGALEGGSVKPGSSKQNNRYGSSMKTSTVMPSAEAKPSDEAKPADK